MHWNKQTTHEKQNLSKTEQSVVICIKRILLELQKFLNNFLDLSNLSINIMQKVSTIYHILTFLGNFCNSGKLSVFKQQHHINFTQVFPKVLLGTLLKQKAIKHDYYSSIIMWTQKTVRVNIGLSPNKRFSLMPF